MIGVRRIRGKQGGRKEKENRKTGLLFVHIPLFLPVRKVELRQRINICQNKVIILVVVHAAQQGQTFSLANLGYSLGGFFFPAKKNKILAHPI
ncbi:hypothetical protein Pyn_40873 [Prunus yedoensis var. nudiflora]|uniref:Uncharacterized protein n=1 Tax=Prunus yedoensis var. nudiflora TaxID=2094558 RepID=A0A314YMG8_PRUYE|nr:hypothetical protein Pyn_40873 [Prunus yedoensis var. nudiflora]